MKIRQIAPYVWPSGWWWSIASLPMTPDQLAERYGLVFERGEDDGLGPYHLAAIALSDGSQCWLKYNEGDPTGHTNIYVDEGADLELSRTMVLEALDLTMQDFAWVNPNSNGVTPQPSDGDAAALSQEQLLEVWAVINALTASLCRLGGYSLFATNEEVGAELLKYTGKTIALPLARARKIMDAIVIPTLDDATGQSPFDLGDSRIPYWKQSTNEVPQDQSKS